MRTRLFLIAIFLSSPLILFSQDEIGIPKLKPSGSYWSIGYYASGSYTLSDDFSNYAQKEPEYGYGGSIEITYTENKSDYMIIASMNRHNLSRYSYYETFEFTLGSRIKLNKTGSFFTEISGGLVGLTRIREAYYEDFNYYYSYSEETKSDFGAAAGLGCKIKLDKNSSLMFKVRMLSMLPVNNSKMFTYISASTGIVLNSIKTGSEKKKTERFGITVLAGANNPKILSKWDYRWSHSFGLECSYAVSPKIEITASGNFNKINFKGEEITYHQLISAGIGGRFYVNENPLTAFIEFGGGFYEYTFTSKAYVIREIEEILEDNFGMCIGTGTKFNIIKQLDFILKSDLNFIFSGRYQDTPNYLAVQGGLRYNL